MPITVFVPGPLRAHCGGQRKLSFDASSVRDALDQLERGYPDVYRGVCDETRTVRRHINLFVNESHMRELDGLDTAMKPGDELTILPAVSGG